MPQIDTAKHGCAARVDCGVADPICTQMLTGLNDAISITDELTEPERNLLPRPALPLSQDFSVIGLIYDFGGIHGAQEKEGRPRERRP